jgi:hypothetical protein
MAEITVPDHLSLEGRANMIADETCRIEQAGNPTARRAHVKAVALAHLRAAFDQAQRVKDNS